MGPDKLLEFFNKREAAIEREKADPYRYGYEISELWEEADEQLRTHGEMLIAGGNRASKSEYAAKRVVESLVNNPASIIWCFSETAQTSISTQQALIWKYLPPEYKMLGRGKVGYVSWSLKNGFTNQKFTLPNRSVCQFKNYSQSIETIEGIELGSPEPALNNTHNIGYWADELCPLPVIEALRYRCLTRSDADTGLPARGIVSFTAVTGWNATVKSFFTGAVTVKDIEADLLPGERVPVVMQPPRKTSVIVFFGTKFNPFGGWPAMKKQLDGADKATILCRAYGVPTRQAETPFPQFTDKNIRKHDEIPILTDPDKNPATWILVVDPAGARPWSMNLIGIDAHNVAWVVDEFPDVPSYGPWVDFTRGDKGKPGDGQQPLGFGIIDYSEQIKKMEKGREFVERIIDPRMGAASFAKADGSTNIIDSLNEEGIAIYPAAGIDIEQGVQAINNLLSWDETKPMGLTNHPNLMFSDRCQNTIACLQEWRHDGDSKSPTKDFVDTIRYFAVGNYQHWGEDDLRSTGTGGY